MSTDSSSQPTTLLGSMSDCNEWSDKTCARMVNLIASGKTMEETAKEMGYPPEIIFKQVVTYMHENDHLGEDVLSRIFGWPVDVISHYLKQYKSICIDETEGKTTMKDKVAETDESTTAADELKSDIKITVKVIEKILSSTTMSDYLLELIMKKYSLRIIPLECVKDFLYNTKYNPYYYGCINTKY